MSNNNDNKDFVYDATKMAAEEALLQSLRADELAAQERESTARKAQIARLQERAAARERASAAGSGSNSNDNSMLTFTDEFRVSNSRVSGLSVQRYMDASTPVARVLRT